MGEFRGVDYFQIEESLSDDERIVRDTIRDFVEEKIVPMIEEHNRQATFPLFLVRELGELGCFGSTLEGYGCAGLNNVAYGLLCQELERGDSGIRSFVSVQSSLVMYPIYTFGSEAQKDRWLPQLAQGEKIGCFGLTEPDYGSNPGGMITKAEKVQNGFLLSGAKMWITNGK